MDTGFPLYIRLGSLSLHPHAVFEALSYFAAARIYFWQRRRQGDTIAAHQRWTVVAAAVTGAAVGGRVLYWLEDPALTLARWSDPAYLLGGKTVVGALLGGLLAVEAAKLLSGITRRTGDLFAIPLAVGIAIGRIGCFLTGVTDGTWGLASAMPWAIDGGDGVLRHPTPLYELVLLAGLLAVLLARARRPRAEGALFRDFMVGYLAARLLVDVLKPEVRVALGLSSIQWACVGALAYYARRGGIRPSGSSRGSPGDAAAHAEHGHSGTAARSGASRVCSSSSR